MGTINPYISLQNEEKFNVYDVIISFSPLHIIENINKRSLCNEINPGQFFLVDKCGDRKYNPY